MKDFMHSTVPNRIYIIINDKDVNHIYDLLSNHLKLSVEELKKKYNITLHVVRRRIEITGGQVEIYELFQYLYSRNVKFESINAKVLRIDLYEFINKII